MTGDMDSGAIAPYVEYGCARRWPLLVLGVGMPVLMALCLMGGLATGDQGFALLLAIPLFVWIFTDARLLFQYWPTGVRIDAAGIRIGGVRRAERQGDGRAAPRASRRNPPPPSRQCYQVFSVPWAGVRSIAVITDRKELCRLRKQSRRGPTRDVRARGGKIVGVRLGMLAPPFIRAALVIEVDPELVVFPEFRIQQSLGVATSQAGTQSSTWVAPTRRPHQLQTTIDRITGSPSWDVRSR